MKQTWREIFVDFSSTSSNTASSADQLPLCWMMLGLNQGLLRLWHWQSDTLSSRLDLIHTRLDLIHARIDLIHTRLDLIQSARSHPHSTKSHPHSERSHPHSARSHPNLHEINIQKMTETKKRLSKKEKWKTRKGRREIRIKEQENTQ